MDKRTSEVMQRTTSQNAKYHKLIGLLYTQREIKVWDGRFIQGGIENPYVVIPEKGSLQGFRDFMKVLDLEYPRDSEGKPLSSRKLSAEELGSHINFLDCLCAELGE